MSKIEVDTETAPIVSEIFDRGIVGNEKYTGNAMLQKSYRNNHLEKKRCRNTGELPMYYAEETHPAIITEETFKATQAILQENRYSQIIILLFCVMLTLFGKSGFSL